MFTGIIEELGQVRSMEQRGENARLVIEARLVTEDIHEGDSIAVNGVCLTALDVNEGSFAADVSRETLDRSTLGRLKPGAPVNLERSVTPVTRLGGHLVQGHVDARGKFLSATDLGGSWTVRIAYPPEIARYLVFKAQSPWKESASPLPHWRTTTSKLPSFPKPGRLPTFLTSERAMRSILRPM